MKVNLQRYIGDVIKKRRMDEGLTQLQLSEKVGCTKQSICNIERGRNSSVTIIGKIFQVLDIDIEIIDKKTRKKTTR